MDVVRELVLPATERRPESRNGSLFFIGTATTLLRYAGFTILTDPNFLHKGEKVHIGYGMKSTRQTNPAITIEQLPSLDLVLLSHMHEDHFDRVVERKLNKTLPIVTTPQAAKVLQKKGFGAMYPLKKWEKLTVIKGDTQLRITSMPGTHAPGPLSFLMPQVMGSMLEFQTAGVTTFRMYITGDTLVFKQLKQIPKRFPDIDLALLHLGGTKVMGLMLTMDGQQGVRAMKIVSPRTAIPVHYNDYTVFKSPLEDFQKAVTAAGLSNRVKYLYAGETYSFETQAGRRR